MGNRFGVRARIIVTSVAVFAAVLAAIALILWNALAMAMGDSAEEAARGQVARMTTQLATLDPVAVVPEAPPMGDRVQQVWSAEGFVLATSNPTYRDRVALAIGVTPPVGDTAIVRGTLPQDGTSGQVVAAVERVVTSDGSIVTAVAVESAHVQPAAQLRLFVISAALMGAAFLLLLLLLFFAVRSALDPVEEMRSELERITSSKERAQVTVPRRDDEIGRLGRTINDLLARLRRSDEQRAAFVSDAGHELRSPLATVAISLEQLRSDPQPERRAVIAERASEEVRRLSDLVDDLLALAAADEGRLLRDLEDVDLDDIVLTEVGVARAKGAHVEVSLEPIRVQGVAPHLQRVARNLLDNARRHARTTIRVAVQTEDGWAVLTVDNDGDPVPVADRRRVFARFVRLDDARDRDTGGSGLGLSIVASLVAAHAGTVEADEAADGWCRFTVRLPHAAN